MPKWFQNVCWFLYGCKMMVLRLQSFYGKLNWIRVHLSLAYSSRFRMESISKSPYHQWFFANYTFGRRLNRDWAARSVSCILMSTFRFAEQTVPEVSDKGANSGRSNNCQTFYSTAAGLLLVFVSLAHRESNRQKWSTNQGVLDHNEICVVKKKIKLITIIIYLVCKPWT